MKKSNKICADYFKNRTKKKNVNISSFVNIDFIFKIIKLIVAFAIAICVLTFAIFHITYMSQYSFFSYDLLSFNNIWLFAYMFLTTTMFAIVAFPFNVICFYEKRNKKRDWTFRICFYFLMPLFVFAIFIPVFYGAKNIYWTWFCLVISFSYWFFIESCVYFYENRKINEWIFLLSIVPILIITFAFSEPKPFNKAITMFLQNKSLAADKVEIYLKDKNKFVCGKMVFRDSKFAYVLYNDIVSNTNCIDSKEPYTLKQLVPIENVTIINPLPKDSQ